MSEQEGKNENVTKTTAKEDKKTSLAREISVSYTHLFHLTARS